MLGAKFLYRVRRLHDGYAVHTAFSTELFSFFNLLCPAVEVKGSENICCKHFCKYGVCACEMRNACGVLVEERDCLEDPGVDEKIIPYILKSNPHPNLIRASFCRFLKQKKKLVRGSNPHLSFNRPLPTRKTDWIILDVTNALTVIRLTRRVSSGHLTASDTNAPQLIRRWHCMGGRWWR